MSELIDPHLDALDTAALLAEVRARIAEDPVPGSRIAMEYAFAHADEGFDTLDPRGPAHAEAFAAFVGMRAEAALAEALDRLWGDVRWAPDGRVRLWRELVVDEGWGEEGLRARPVGVCWGWEPGAAEAHNGEGHGAPGRVLAVVEALAEPGCVDWAETVALNAAAEHTVGDEREIRLRDDAVVEVAGLAVRPCGRGASAGVPVDVSGLAGAVLAAGPDAPLPVPSPAF